MNCPNCGKYVRENQKFCTKCGCSIFSSIFFETKEDKKDYINAWIYTALVIVIFLILAWQ